MKKIMNSICFFAVIVLSLVFAYPLNTYALTSQTSYVNINNTESLEVGSLSFTDISFNDYSSTSTQAFGLAGIVRNNSNNEISYTSTAYYYDSNYNLIAQGYNLATAISGTSDFNQMSNFSILSGHNVNEIYYYRLSIEMIDNDNLPLLDKTSLTPSMNPQYSSYDYVIDKYDINIIVNENNTFDITETITAYFNIPKHGIFRTIPLKNTITRLDGTKSTNRTQVTNVNVDSEYTTSRENGNYKLKIGSASRTLTEEQTYVIKYTYNLGKDPLKNYDELYYNIIGTEWDTVIGNITFTITMPKEFDSSKLGFSSGIKGSTNNDKVKYNVNGNKITGSYDGILGVGKALTVRCELPEGYFVGAKLSMNASDYIVFLIPIIFLGISIFLWHKFGRDDQVIETVEFYPPEGFNSLEVALLYKGQARDKDVISLLIYLANKGYLEICDDKIDLNAKKVNLSENSKISSNQKIVELQNKIAFEKQSNPNSPKIKYYENMLDIYKNIDTPIDYKKYGIKSSNNNSNRGNKFLIKKLKDYDGENINEKRFMEGLFEDDRTEVTDQMLYNSFYITVNRILGNINKKGNIDKIFEKSSLRENLFIIVMIIVSYCAITIPPIWNFGQLEELIFVLFFSFIHFPLMLSIRKERGFWKASIFLNLILVLCFGIMPWLFVVLPILVYDFLYLIGYIIGILCIIGMIVCLFYLPKRTKYGNEMFGKIKGFKNFLETAEKEKLEAMVQENPNYFYDILPFTYVLGVSNKWIKKFESISLKAPSWYDSPNAFDVSTFGTFMNHTMKSAQSAMLSSPPIDSGGSGSSFGGSSGGGSSGGGSGGGGGGSW